MTPLDELEALLAKATPGPWEAHARPWLCKGKPVDEWNIRTTWIHGQLKDKAGVVSRSIHFSDEEKDRHGVWMSSEDATLIAAAVNALPKLIAALRKYQRVAESSRDQWGDDYLWQKWGHDRDMQEAEAALADLNKETK